MVDRTSAYKRQLYLTVLQIAGIKGYPDLIHRALRILTAEAIAGIKGYPDG